MRCTLLFYLKKIIMKLIIRKKVATYMGKEGTKEKLDIELEAPADFTSPEEIGRAHV